MKNSKINKKDSIPNPQDEDRGFEMFGAVILGLCFAIGILIIRGLVYYILT